MKIILERSYAITRLRPFAKRSRVSAIGRSLMAQRCMCACTFFLWIYLVFVGFAIRWLSKNLLFSSCVTHDSKCLT